MALNNLEVFFRDNADHIKQIGDRKDTSIGFNAFALVSDVYYRENFHSDIIAAILNPHSDHGEGTLFLKKFLTFVSEVARDKGKRGKKKGYFLKLAKKLQALVATVDDSVEVAREKGRIDVKTMAPNWTIIVENKINGAYDMDRQIPRYIEQCRDQGEKVEAVIYITAANPGFPSDNGWKKPDDNKMVKPLLVPVIGFSETRSIKNLAEDWIGACVNETQDLNVKSILSQYAELLRHQSGETMNQDEVKEVMQSMVKHNISYPDLTQVIQEIPRVLARTIKDKFSGHPALKKAWLWPPSPQKWEHGIVFTETVAALELKDFLCGGRSITLGIDIWCENFEDEGVTFFAREDDIGPRIFLPILEEDGFREGGSDGRLVLDMGFKTDWNNWVYAHQEEFLRKIERILDDLAENRERMEEIIMKAIRNKHKAKTKSRA
jgi:hypothetical protein